MEPLFDSPKRGDENFDGGGRPELMPITLGSGGGEPKTGAKVEPEGLQFD